MNSVASKQESASEEQALMISGLRIAGADGQQVVYTRGSLDIVLTLVIRNLAPMGVPDAPARAVVAILNRLQLVLRSRNLNWTALTDEIRSSVVELFRLMGAPVVVNSTNRMTVHVQAGRSPNTVNAWIYALRSGFDQLIVLRHRKGTNPLASLGQRRGAIQSYSAAVRDPEQAAKYGRVPIGLMKLSRGDRHGRRLVTFLKIDLPAQIKAAGKRARWGDREWVVFYLMVDAGARVSEACEVTMAGWALEGLGNTLWLRNKGSEGVLVKKAVLSDEGYLALERYFMYERSTQDPLASTFLVWAQGEPYTPRNYLRFLIAQKIDPASVSVLLNSRKKPLQTDSFRDDHWARMRKWARLMTLTPHHLRHWYVNQELERIEHEHGQNRKRHQDEIYAFIDKMHWTQPTSLLTYDHSDKIRRLMDWHLRRSPVRTAPESTGVGSALGFSNAQKNSLTGSTRADIHDVE